MEFSNIGCEYYPTQHDEIAQLIGDGVITHLQVSVPSVQPLKQLQRVQEFGVPVVVHSNLMSLGENKSGFDEERAAEVIRSFKPLHVVEHFSHSKVTTNKECVSYTPSSQETFERICRRLMQWRGFFDCKVGLETVPHAGSDWSDYIAELHKISDLTGCGYVYDLPHVIIGAISQGLSIIEAREILCNEPTQIHMGGVAIRNGHIYDSHCSVSPWLLKELHKPNWRSSILTLEQREGTSISRLISQLNRIVTSTTPNLSGLLAESDSEFNQNLATENADRLFGEQGKWIPSLVRNDTGLRVTGLFKWYNDFHPFFFPVSEVQQKLRSSSLEDGLGMVGKLCARAVNFSKSLGVLEQDSEIVPHILESAAEGEYTSALQSVAEFQFANRTVTFVLKTRAQ